MGIGGSGALGIVLLAIGVLLLLVGQQGVQEYQTTSGQISRALSEEQRSNYEMYSSMRLFGGMGAVVGGILFVVGLASSSGSNGPSGGRQPPAQGGGPPPQPQNAGGPPNANQGGPMSNYDHDTVPPGNFVFYELSVNSACVVDFSIDVFEGPPVNILFTDRLNLERFKQTGTGEYYPDASELNTRGISRKTRLPPGDHAIIVDNTNSITSTANGPASYELEYEVRQ